MTKRKLMFLMKFFLRIGDHQWLSVCTKRAGEHFTASYKRFHIASLTDWPAGKIENRLFRALCEVRQSGEKSPH